jgi:hypothetical protein
VSDGDAARLVGDGRNGRVAKKMGDGRDTTAVHQLDEELVGA